VLLLLAVRIARIPRGAIPLPPRWLWVWLATAASITLAAGGAPMLRIGHVEVGCGGLVNVVRLTALSLVILATSALVTWTTDIADVARRLPHGVAGRGQGDAPSRIGRSRSHCPWEPRPC
jgi:energy-coupling factor transport system permease protein